MGKGSVANVEIIHVYNETQMHIISTHATHQYSVWSG